MKSMEVSHCNITFGQKYSVHFIGNSSHPTSMLELQEDYHDEYDDLSKKEKEELVQEFNDEKGQLRKIPHPTARSRSQDVANVVRNIRLLVRLIFTSIAMASSDNNTLADHGLEPSCRRRSLFLHRPHISRFPYATTILLYI